MTAAGFQPRRVPWPRGDRVQRLNTTSGQMAMTSDATMLAIPRIVIPNVPSWPVQAQDSLWANHSGSPSPLEELHGTLVLLGRREAVEGPEIPSLPGLRIFLQR